MFLIFPTTLTKNSTTALSVVQWSALTTSINIMNSNDLQKEQELERLRRENESLTQEVNHLKKRLRNAKDPTPIERVSMRRLVEVARQACLDLKRSGRKVLVTLGSLQRKFNNLREAWEFLDQEEWLLEELFPPKPPKPKKFCRFCHSPIVWGNGAAGWLPFGLDGIRHRCRGRVPALAPNPALTVPFGD
jgi:CRISPR/Cas system CMR-associated protein Cmr5 small subunit